MHPIGSYCLRVMKWDISKKSCANNTTGTLPNEQMFSNQDGQPTILEMYTFIILNISVATVFFCYLSTTSKIASIFIYQNTWSIPFNIYACSLSYFMFCCKTKQRSRFSKRKKKKYLNKIHITHGSTCHRKTSAFCSRKFKARIENKKKNSWWILNFRSRNEQEYRILCK